MADENRDSLFLKDSLYTYYLLSLIASGSNLLGISSIVLKHLVQNNCKKMGSMPTNASLG